MNVCDEFERNISVDYSYDFAKSMERYKTNPVLGYRTAGSAAEFQTGEMLAEEMKKLGLNNVRKDKITVDSWNFEKAVLRAITSDGQKYEFQLGAYQTNFHTNGQQVFDLVYVGNGTASDYENKDVGGKLVLADIDQRDEWWINFPVYQAHIRGAAAFLAVQKSGYGEIHDTSLNAQDIAGPPDAPAFSISQADAYLLKQELEKTGIMKVTLDAESTVLSDQVSYNIIGEIPGKNTEEMILLSAHYDSYFNGFQDDNTAVSMMLGIAKSWIETGYQPERTWVFCAMAAEEWGISNSKYDWSTGAWQQVFKVHPDWAGKIIADLNFELPAHAHNRKDAVRCTYEYKDFMEEFISNITVDQEAYPDGIEVLCPIETWSDDFSVAISGIPSMVNDFSAGSFMETHYHSQFDNEEYYQEAVYRFHHVLYGKLLWKLDQLYIVPMNFSHLFHMVRQTLDHDLCRRMNAPGEELDQLLRKASIQSQLIYDTICTKNQKHLDQKSVEKSEARRWNSTLLAAFKKSQDHFVRLNWHDEVIFPQQAVQNNLRHIDTAIACLKKQDVHGALEAVYGVDNNRYAFLFEEKVYFYFTDYVLNQPKDRLQWGADRIIHHENLFLLVQNLKKKANNIQTEDFLEEEIQMLKQVKKRQEDCYADDIRYLIHSVDIMMQMMKELNEV